MKFFKAINDETLVSDRHSDTTVLLTCSGAVLTGRNGPAPEQACPQLAGRTCRTSLVLTAAARFLGTGRQYGVRGIPTVIVFKKGEDEISAPRWQTRPLDARIHRKNLKPYFSGQQPALSIQRASGGAISGGLSECCKPFADRFDFEHLVLPRSCIQPGALLTSCCARLIARMHPAL